MGGPNMTGSSITGVIILAIIGLIIFIKSGSKNKKRLLKTIGFVFAALITRGIVAAAVADSGVDIDGLTPATLIALGIILVEFFALRNKKLITRILVPALTVIGFVLLILTVVNSNRISDVFSPGVLLIIAAVIALIIIFKKASGKVKAVLITVIVVAAVLALAFALMPGGFENNFSPKILLIAAGAIALLFIFIKAKRRAKIFMVLIALVGVGIGVGIRYIPEDWEGLDAILNKGDEDINGDGTSDRENPLKDNPVYIAVMDFIDKIPFDKVFKSDDEMDNGDEEQIQTALQPSYGLEYSLSSSGLYYTVTGIGSCTDTVVVIPSIHDGLPVKAIADYAFSGSNVNSVHIGWGITNIGMYAFNSMYSLHELTIPSSITAIDAYAFTDTQISRVYISDASAWCEIIFANHTSNPLHFGADLYLNGELVTDLIIPGKIETIRSYTFVGCTSLRSVTLPDDVKVIGERAFSGCKAMTDLFIGNRLSDVGEYAFEGCEALENVHISDIAAWCGITFKLNESNPLFYAENLYLNKDRVTELVIPEDVTKINNGAFYGYDSLRKLVIGDDVIEIGNQAFSGCLDLISVTLGDNVTTIAEYAFWNCEKLIEVVNNSPLSISCGDYSNGYIAYYAKDVHMGGSAIDEVDGYLFYNRDIGVNYLLGYAGEATELVLPTFYNDTGYSIYQYAFRGMSDIESFSIPGTVYEIGSYAFADCKDLKSVSIANGVESIKTGAFSACVSLRSIVIPDSVTTLGVRAFNGCINMLSAHIGNGITAIPESTFSYCPNLTDVVIGNSVTGIEISAFYHCFSLVRVVIGESVNHISNDAFIGCNKIVEIVNHSSLNIRAGYANHGGIAENALSVISSDFDKYESKIKHVNEFLFYEDSDGNTSGNVYLIAYLGDDSLLVLPESYNGRNYNILSYAFDSDKTIENIVMPTSVTNIEDYAFYGLTPVPSIYYCGSQKEWFSVGKPTNDNYFDNARVYYYSESEPEIWLNDYWFYGENGEIVNWADGYVITPVK